MTGSEIRDRIQHLLDLQKGMSRKAFAEKAGIDNANMAKMLSGSQSITRKTLQKISSAYNVREQWLLTGEGEMLKSSPVSSKREGVDSKREGVGSAPQAPSEKDIVEFRKSLNLTQLAFAAKIGINQGYMSAIEQGKRPLTETVLAAIAKAFGPAAAKDLCAPPPKPEAADAAVAPDKALDKALDEIAEQRKLVAKAQEQIDRLITLLEKVSNN